MAELKTQAEKDKLTSLVDQYWQDVVNKSIAKYWQDNFAEQLAKTDIPTQVVEQTAPIQDPIDTQTGQPVSQWTADNIETNRQVDAWLLPENQRENIPQVEPTKQPEVSAQMTQEIKPQDEAPAIKQPEAPVTQPTTGLPASIQDWKAQGSNIADLERMIETQNNTTITNENGVLKGTIDGVEYQWNIDQQGNPIKTKVWWEDPNAIYQQLLAWQILPETWIKTTQAYSKAKARYDVASKYIWMTENQLYNAYVNWEINTTLENDLATNPNLQAAKERYNKKIVTDNINKESSIILNAYNKANWKTGTQEVEQTPLEQLSNKFLTLFENMWKTDTEVSSFKGYMAENYPDLVNDTKELNAKSKLVRELADARDWRIDDIIKNNPWISINKANMLAARQNKDINEQIKSMSYEIANLSANINYQTSMADKEYWYEQDRLAKEAAIAQEQRGYAFNLLNTAQAQAFQQQQTADQRAYEQANKWVSTSMIQVWDKQQLINSQTWEVIKEYDLATWTAKAPWVERIWTDNQWWAIYWTYNQTTWKYEPISIAWANQDEFWNIDYNTLDWSTNTDLINQYTWEASFKNNNPTWMTWGISSNLKSLFDESWVNYTKWTERPTAEWWNYIKFASVQDWLDAYRIALTEAWSNNVYNRLATWVWTQDTATNDAYAKWLMDQAWIEKWATFDELSEQQLWTLMSAQLQKESPNFYKELSNVPEPSKPLTDKQFTQSNQVINSFKSDPQVKAFEEAYSQWLNLISSLADKTWPWDVAGIFQFMKTLDPQSVVRESEFEVAANSAWVINKLWNTFDRLKEWKVLTDTQAEAFWALAKQFIINKSSLYDTKYNDGIRRLEKQWIDTSVFPSSTADEMRKILETWETNQTWWRIVTTTWGRIK